MPSKSVFTRSKHKHTLIIKSNCTWILHTTEFNTEHVGHDAESQRETMNEP